MPIGSARHRKNRGALTEAAIVAILSGTLPRKNGYVRINAASLLKEAVHFKVDTFLKYRRLILKHRLALLRADRGAVLDSTYLRLCTENYAEPTAREMRRRQFCFSWEALARTAFELEFGSRYDDFSRERDGI